MGGWGGLKIQKRCANAYQVWSIPKAAFGTVKLNRYFSIFSKKRSTLFDFSQTDEFQPDCRQDEHHHPSADADNINYSSAERKNR